MKDRPKIVCLCGSGRFRAEFEEAEYNETLSGKIVLTIGCNTQDIARSEELKHHKPMLDELHMRKIDMSDEVLIINKDGYIGESTGNELRYAQSLNKHIRFLEPNPCINMVSIDIEKLSEDILKADKRCTCQFDGKYCEVKDFDGCSRYGNPLAP